MWRFFRHNKNNAPLSLKQVADEQIILEHCQKTKAFFLGQTQSGLKKASLSNFSRNPFMKWVTRNMTLYRYHLRNVVLDSYYMVLFKDGQVIPDSNCVLPSEIWKNLKVDTENLISYDKSVACCFDHWAHNYFHWMAHAIPTFYISKQEKHNATFLVPELKDWQIRTLELLDIDKANCLPIEKTKQYFFSDFYYYDFATGRADFAISQRIQDAYTYLGKKVALNDETKHQKIYISRLNKENRQVTNEAALVEALRERGYFILDPETLTIDQQINIFKQARLVVALLGAGLTNIAFCKPGTFVYELIPSHHQNPCFLKMSMQGHLAYWADQFETGVSTMDHTSPCTAMLDIRVIMQRLDEIEALMPN